MKVLTTIVMAAALTLSGLWASGQDYRPVEQYAPGYLPAGNQLRDLTPPVLALKTNLLYWGTTSPNFAVEFALARKWTLETTVGWNPWEFDNGMSLRHWLVQPEARYWFCRRFEGWFVGAHGIYGRFNMGNWSFGPKAMQDYMYKGYGYGGGVAVGHHWAIGRRWGLELTAGLGYLFLDYDKYECEGCANYVGKYNRHYFGPTKAGINLIYKIK